MKEGLWSLVEQVPMKQSKKSDWKWIVAAVVGWLLIGGLLRSLTPESQPKPEASTDAKPKAAAAKPKAAAAKPKAPAADPWTNLSGHIYPGVHVYAGKGASKGSLGDVKEVGNGQVLILLDDGRERWYERSTLTSGYFFVKSDDPALP